MSYGTTRRNNKPHTYNVMSEDQEEVLIGIITTGLSEEGRDKKFLTGNARFLQMLQSRRFSGSARETRGREICSRSCRLGSQRKQNGYDATKVCQLNCAIPQDTPPLIFHSNASCCFCCSEERCVLVYIACSSIVNTLSYSVHSTCLCWLPKW